MDLPTGGVLAKYLVSMSPLRARLGMSRAAIQLLSCSLSRKMRLVRNWSDTSDWKGVGMSDVVNVTLRAEEEAGTRACRRMRSAGFVPAVLYGHKEAVVSLKVKPTEVMSAICAGHKLVDLKGAVNESALLKTIQWDAFGTELVHVDFARVSAGELVRTKVLVELRGEATGTKEGGVLKFVTHDLEIEAPASSIPEKIFVSVKELRLDGEIFARDVPLPEGVKLVGHGDDVIVSCDKPLVEEEEGTGAPSSMEPELIRKEKTGDEESSDS